MLCSCNDFSDMMLFGEANFAKAGLAIVAKLFRQAILPRNSCQAVPPRHSAKPFGLAIVASHMIQADFAKPSA